MMNEIIERLEDFLRVEGFDKNWDGLYQDVLPTIRRFLDSKGFSTVLVGETESESRTAELVATDKALTVRVPWEEDYNGRSLVNIARVVVTKIS